MDWALPKDKYLEAIGSQQIGKLDEERIQNNDSEEKGMGNDQEEDNDDEMEQDEDEQEEDNIINEGDDESQDEEKQEIDDDMNCTDVSGNENNGDNVSYVIENKIPCEDNDKGKSSEDESDVTEIHNEAPKIMYPLSEGTVLFIRNLSFDATEEELSNM